VGGMMPVVARCTTPPLISALSKAMAPNGKSAKKVNLKDNYV